MLIRVVRHAQPLRKGGEWLRNVQSKGKLTAQLDIFHHQMKKSFGLKKWYNLQKRLKQKVRVLQ